MDYRTDNDWGYRYSLCRQHSLLCSDKRQFLRVIQINFCYRHDKRSVQTS